MFAILSSKFSQLSSEPRVPLTASQSLNVHSSDYYPLSLDIRRPIAHCTFLIPHSLRRLQTIP